MPGDILDQIDRTLEAWEMGPDAAHWAGEPNETEWEDDQPWISPQLWYAADLSRHIDHIDHIDQSTRQMVERWQRQFEHISELMANYRRRYVLGFDGSGHTDTISHFLVSRDGIVTQLPMHWYVPQRSGYSLTNVTYDEHEFFRPSRLTPENHAALCGATNDASYAGTITASCSSDPVPIVVRGDYRPDETRWSGF